MVQLVYMKKLRSYIFLFTVTLPFFAHAAALPAATENEESLIYKACIKNAEQKRDMAMTPARKIYVAESAALTSYTKNRLEVIKWHIDSIYKTESKEIYREHAEELTKIQNKISAVRMTAQSTWKAESSLCDFANKKEQPVKGATKK